jgi:hypothetical protein
MIVEHGPPCGEYKGKPIPSYIVDQNGARLEFDRIAIETDGGVELSQLANNECVIAPGLIYRHGAKDRRCSASGDLGNSHANGGLLEAADLKGGSRDT